MLNKGVFQYTSLINNYTNGLILCWFSFWFIILTEMDVFKLDSRV